MIRCCIFDADGTLLDSMPMWRDITYQYAADKGIQAPQGLHNTLNRLSVEQCAEYYRGLGVSGTVEGIAQELGQYALEGYRTQVEEKPQAREFLQLLKENHIPVAVATASNREGVELALERLGMLPFVDRFATCGEVGKSKEHPDIFLHCAGKFGAAPEESVVFEDSAYAIRTARKRGIPGGGCGRPHLPARQRGRGNPGGHCRACEPFHSKLWGADWETAPSGRPVPKLGGSAGVTLRENRILGN